MDGSLAVIRTDDPRFLDLDGSDRTDAVIADDFYGIPNTGGGW